MEGFTYNNTDPQRGIIPRSIEEIFNYIEMYSSSDTKFMVRASYLQIYNESISDLLKPEKISLQIREDKKKGVFVESLSEWAVRSPSDIYTLLQRGASVRATACTKMNDVSSRSHAVFVITVEQMTIHDNNGEQSTQIKVGKLNLVDLAGSERIRVTGATGKQLEESKKINKSLSALGNVIYALTDNKGRSHIPYRDSKLTRLLEDSLGGNCKTTMMAMISPAHDSFNESVYIINFSYLLYISREEPRILKTNLE
jgi:kinesin family protein 3/17